MPGRTMQGISESAIYDSAVRRSSRLANVFRARSTVDSRANEEGGRT